ncbi:glycosyltransferase 87 family protein [Kitasatospora kazusensis]|uniref:Glycosyltransferase 87 family protein n=1 Tax=Kitasatospora kazusensis TaxID=407974 RepID=A0ABP5LL61_9ACTN
MQAVGWTLAAGWAAVFPLASAVPNQVFWGALAAPAYAVAALLRLALPRRIAAAAAAGAALLGAVLLPLVLLSLSGRRQSEVMVVERSADLLVHTGVPYLPHPVLASDFNPYLPMMTLFGVPRAVLGNVGPVNLLLGDARVWFAAAFLGCLLACGRLLGAGSRWRLLPPLAALTASPLIALALTGGGVDLPLIGVCCLALALAANGRALPAGLVLGFACALKWTAWPALPVAALLLWRLYGRRPAARAAGTALLASAAVILPFALTRAGVLLEQVVRFPLGLTAVPTPAGSPLPGRVLAGLGPVGHAVSLALLCLGSVAVAGWLLVRPPTGAVAACDRLAAGLTVAFALAPAGRFGYLALPTVLVLWPRLAAGRARRVAAAGPVERYGTMRVADRRTGSAARESWHG